ncbi:MAG: hypothetical protein O2894_00825 [Planctomycetota bacterium]|nr:hypothetical protein [Planctomycetota bacterium]
MIKRIQRTALAGLAAILFLAPSAMAYDTFPVAKVGKSGQVYTWEVGHC